MSRNGGGRHHTLGGSSVTSQHANHQSGFLVSQWQLESSSNVERHPRDKNQTAFPAS